MIGRLLCILGWHNFDGNAYYNQCRRVHCDLKRVDSPMWKLMDLPYRQDIESRRLAEKSDLDKKMNNLGMGK